MENDYILIIDDDSDIRNLIGIYLENEGYKYIKCDNAVSALEAVQTTKFALILLDVMMPQMDGITACMKLREKTNAPIIFISAKSEDTDIVNGLMSGGDDYVTKPFSPVQLMTRVKAQLRRYRQYSPSQQQSPKTTLEFEDLTVDTVSRQVWVNGVLTELTVKEYEILELLLRNKSIVLSIKRIYEAVWHEEFYAAENTVMMHIANLRKKLSPDGSKTYIKTVWGRGYRI